MDRAEAVTTERIMSLVPSNVLSIRSLRRRLGRSILHPYFLCVLNALMLVLFYSSIKSTWFQLNPANHFEEAVELWEGYGTILLGLGVILEEHASLGHIFGLRRNADSEANAVERVCHDYGVLFCVLGVIVELFAWLVKIPNIVLDSYGVEFAFINISGLAAAICAILQVRFQFEILGAHRAVKRPALD